MFTVYSLRFSCLWFERRILRIMRIRAGAGWLLANYSNWGTSRSWCACSAYGLTKSCRSRRFFLSGFFVRVRGQDNLVDFSPAAEPGAFSITENTERTEKNGNFSSKRRITQIMRIKGGSRSITSELLEFFAGGRAWRFFYYRKYGKNWKKRKLFYGNGEGGINDEWWTAKVGMCECVNALVC